jgi:DNA-binding protein H-NS
MARKAAAEDNAPEMTKLDAIIADLEELDAADLGKLIVECQKRFEAKRQEAREALIARVREEAAALQIDPADLFRVPAAPARRPTRSRGRGIVPAKYKGPRDAVWSGRGRTPAWLAELEAQGRKREEFLVNRDDAELPLAAVE